VLPMAEIGAPLQEGVGRLMREVVGKLMPLVMNEEVQQLVGEKHQFQAQRRAYRWGQEDGTAWWMGRRCGCGGHESETLSRGSNAERLDRDRLGVRAPPNEETHCLKRRRVEQRALAGKRDAGQ
jgi:hypothetical protein